MPRCVVRVAAISRYHVAVPRLVFILPLFLLACGVDSPAPSTGAPGDSPVLGAEPETPDAGDAGLRDASAEARDAADDASDADGAN